MTRTQRRKLKKVLFWIVIVVVFVYLVFPFYWALNSSLKTEDQLMMTPATFVPRDTEGNFAPTLQNYKGALSDPTFIRSIWNSTVVGFTTTALALIVGSFSAFALGKLRFKGKKPTLYLILSMTMFPQVTVLSGL